MTLEEALSSLARECKHSCKLRDCLASVYLELGKIQEQIKEVVDTNEQHQD